MIYLVFIVSVWWCTLTVVGTENIAGQKSLSGVFCRVFPVQVSFLFSDRGLPDGFRRMNGYGSHTFKLVNADGERVYCKFHYKVCLSPGFTLI